MKRFKLLFFMISLLITVGAGIRPAYAVVVPQISAGAYHTIALKADGTLWAWGNNAYGQLGIGNTVLFRTSPIQIGVDTTWTAVAAGAYHTIALKADGTLWAWGWNGYGQLGDDTTVNKFFPVQIGAATDWDSVTAGGAHTIALKTGGTLWAWGNNVYGQLGDGTTVNKFFPVQIGAATDWDSVTAGDYHTIAVKTGGTLWAWGHNGAGQLGITILDPPGINEYHSPVKIGVATDWASVTAGDYHTIALKTGGTLWAWGWNGYGQLGNGGATVYQDPPVQIGSATDWASVTAGASYTVAIKTDGTLWAWGYNEYGQLGIGNTAIRLSPVQIGVDTTWTAVAAGNSHAIAVKADGTFWTWGNNAYGQLGDGTTANKLSPVQIMTPKTLTVNVNPAGTGSGTVTGGGTNSIYGTTLQITASADTGSTFIGWSGDCTGRTSPLNVLIDSNKTCTATFQKKFPWPLVLPAITKGVR